MNPVPETFFGIWEEAIAHLKGDVVERESRVSLKELFHIPFAKVPNVVPALDSVRLSPLFSPHTIENTSCE